MKKVISSESIPIKIWLDDIEESALLQARNLAGLPFAFKHIAIMPDAHTGFGMPIGGVLATKNVIVPNAVGVDIGCGMSAVQTTLKPQFLTYDKLNEIVIKIKERIPVGFKHHAEKQDQFYMPDSAIEWDNSKVVCREWENALYQLGTLGGGNHFIEIQKSEEYIWIMIHSGSRNLGKQVADHYNKIAKLLNKKWFSMINPKHDLAFLPIYSKEGSDYILEMQYCVDFALSNRRLMMHNIMDIFKKEYPEIEFINQGLDEIIDIAHNYAKLETHFGENVWVHRKGATSAKEGEIGIIPGSMGTSSYIVQGLGNKESFMSCSHGAGRRMGRTEATKKLNLEEEIKGMGDIIHEIKTNKDLDEAPGAYKNIDQVMNNQTDLVEILVKLTPLAVIKG